MSKEPEHTPELRAFEASLASLAPASMSLDRDRLMFRAGQMSVTSSVSTLSSATGSHKLFWPLATAAGVLFGAALGLLAAGAKEPRIVERVVEVPVEVVARQPALDPGKDVEDSPAPVVARRTLKTLDDLALDGGNSYYALRNRIVAWGADALPSKAKPTADDGPTALRYFELRDNLIHPDRPASKPQPILAIEPRGAST